MSAIVSFGSCNGMLMGGGPAPFADVGGSAWSSAGWLGGRSLCVWFFSDVVGCGVVFFGGAAGRGGVLVRAALLLLVVIGDVSREWAVWLLFSLVSRFFLMFSIIISCGCDAQES